MNAIEAMNSAVRGVIVAPPGKRLVVADWSNIEGRMLVWLTGEEWKLQAFRDFDLGLGADLYKVAYSKSFGQPVDKVSKSQRQIGKIEELSAGFGGGVGAFVTFATLYGIDLGGLAATVQSTAPGWAMAEASSFYDWMVKKGNPTYGLPRNVYVACNAVVRMWREAHPETTSFWRELNDAAKGAVGQPGFTVECRRLKLRRDGNWLRVKLPSGRYLCYPNVRVENNDVTYMGVNQYTRRWERIRTNGGKLTENVTQAAARDILAWALPRVEEAGYETVLHIHDEIITEAPDEERFNHDDLGRLMSINPPWAEGLPLAAAGFTSYRYRKDE